MVGQVLTTTKQGTVDACGIRFIGLPKTPASDRVRMIDGSLNVTAAGRGVGKLIVMEGPRPPDIKTMRTVKILGVWVKAQGKAPAAPITQLIPGETPGSVLYAAQSEPTLDAIHAMASDRTLQIGIKTQVGVETIYFGTVKLEEAERAQFTDCLDELQNVIKK